MNSKPLIEDLPQLLPEAELVLDFPSRLADGLSQGDLDIALIPSIEVFRNPDYEVVTDACVAARGPVRSVKLYSRVPLAEIRSLALDAGSRTSAALVQILLAERFAVEPRLEPLPLGGAVAESGADAVLLIGDRAFHPPKEEFAATWDLGEEWFAWTGLPFVFAMWAARSDADLNQAEKALIAARNRGVQRLETIAEREASALDIPETTAVEYLTQNLYYELASPERSGLKLFHRLAMKLGLAPEGVDLVFRNCSVTR